MGGKTFVKPFLGILDNVSPITNFKNEHLKNVGELPNQINGCQQMLFQFQRRNITQMVCWTTVIVQVVLNHKKGELFVAES